MKSDLGQGFQTYYISGRCDYNPCGTVIVMFEQTRVHPARFSALVTAQYVHSYPPPFPAIVILTLHQHYSGQTCLRIDIEFFAPVGVELFFGSMNTHFLPHQ